MYIYIYAYIYIYVYIVECRALRIKKYLVWFGKVSPIRVYLGPFGKFSVGLLKPSKRRYKSCKGHCISGFSLGLIELKGFRV